VFGYAVDVSQAGNLAGLDAEFGMHDKSGQLSASGVPRLYQSIDQWRASPDYSSNSLFPWWSSTYRGQGWQKNGKGERLDAIFLVGKGWAYDDPVRQYMVMSDTTDRSPLNPGGGGVEMWDEVNELGNYDSYRPNYDAGEGTRAGTAALRTDHLPVGARLRIFKR
jgi:hypothetical protein